MSLPLTNDKSVHLMVDIETLGRTPSAPVIELAVVKFAPYANDNTVLDHVSFQVRPHSLTHADYDTLVWWQSHNACLPVSADARSLSSIVHDLRAWLGTSTYDGLWANDPSFDLVMLATSAAASNVELPPQLASYKLHRSYRTLRALTRNSLTLPRQHESTLHDAACDALHQARNVSRMLQYLASRGVIVA